MISKDLLLGVFLVIMFPVAYGAHVISSKNELLVMAASSIKNVMEKLAQGFMEDNPGTKVLFNFASSGQLRTQITNGARGDIFISASSEEMDTLAVHKLIVPKSQSLFAKNKIVVITNKQQHNISAIDDLMSKSVRTISLGNYTHVPAGKYGLSALKTHGIWPAVSDKVVYTENAYQALQYVAHNVVDAGVVFYTDAFACNDVKIIATFSGKNYPVAVYQIAMLQNSSNIIMGQKFITYLTSKKIRIILQKYGFMFN